MSDTSKQAHFEKVTPENPFMSPAWVWTGATVFQKIYPSLMFFDGQTLTFIDSEDNVLMQLGPADIASIKYNNTLIIIRFTRPILDSKKMVRIMFYGYGSSNFTVPPSYEKQYQSFIDRSMSAAGPEEATKISDNKPTSHY